MIENKVANSKLITLDIAEEVETFAGATIDIAPQLWQGIALKEKDFREFVSALDTSVFENKIVAIYCSVDAIIPVWAYMLLALKLAEVNAQCHFSSPENLDTLRALAFIQQLDISKFQDKNSTFSKTATCLQPHHVWRTLLHCSPLQTITISVPCEAPCETSFAESCSAPCETSFDRIL
jgi:hypothetical protein